MKAYHVNHIGFTRDKAELEIEYVSLMTDMPKPKLIQFSARSVMCDRYLKTEPLFPSTLNAHFRSALVTLFPNLSAYEKGWFAVAYL